MHAPVQNKLSDADVLFLPAISEAGLKSVTWLVHPLHGCAVLVC